MLKDKYLPGWLGPKKPNAEGIDNIWQTLPGSPCRDAEEGAYENPQE